MMMNKIDASIIIPVYNNFEIFKKTFKAILGQNYQKDKYEIIIVDDGSTDGISEFFQTKNYIKECINYNFNSYNVSFFRNEANQGRVKARNIGIANAKGQIIIFLDSDNVPCINFVSEHVKAHNKFNNVVAVGNINFPNDLLKSRFIKFWNSRYAGNIKNLYNKVIPFYYPGTGNGSLKRKDLEMVGHFDESFEKYGGEDEELWYRLCIKKGLRNIFLENAKTVHIDPNFTYYRFLKRMEIYGEHAAPIIFKKHPDYFKTNIFTRYLEPVDFKKDTLKEIIVKLFIVVLTSFPFIFFIEFVTKRFEFNKMIPFPNTFYGIVICKYYLTGVKKRKNIKL